MCGIAGCINYTGRVNPQKTTRMLETMVHRGPDSQGMWSDKYVSLGMRRLSIIDVQGGIQPLYNEDRSIIIIGNGEIYNYKQLNKLVRKNGHRPHTGSDIETIVHLYEDYGVACLKKLVGMFAFALYDTKKKQIILGRDRLGEKPLYYAQEKNDLYFASELKAIIKNVRHDQIDHDAINLYFHYYFVPEPRTLFPNIHKIPAGYYCQIDTQKNEIQMHKYWDVEKREKDNANPIHDIKRMFQSSVKSALVADVDVAVALSGGIDSTAILATAAKLSSRQLTAFTVGYEGVPKQDERGLASIVAKKYHARHVQEELKARDVVTHFPQLVYDGDDPIADIAGYGIYSVAKLAHKQGIKVLLGGLGGDEIFWGYPWVRNVTQQNVRSPSSYHFYDVITPFKDAERYIAKLTTKTFSAHIDTALPKNIFQPDQRLKNAHQHGRYSQDLIRDFWLISNCIAYNDRLSMAASVELRSPLLNHILVEYAYTNSKNVESFQKKTGKYWFKKAVRNILPPEIASAPKRGFQPPVAKWLFFIIMKYRRLLDDGYLVSVGILERSSVSKLKYTWLLNPFRWYSMYQLLVLEIWCREYVWGESVEKVKNVK